MDGRISLSQDPKVSLLYAGEMIAAFVERAGGAIDGKLSTGNVPSRLQPIYVHRQSRPPSRTPVELLRNSNNHIANQVFPEIGGRRRGGAASLENSSKVANEMLGSVGSREEARSQIWRLQSCFNTLHYWIAASA
jgi:D-alanyl-D-alanine carboxypeptidase/D-alanyl-D-alanine-endopeptidase (penicillin-binding protein 4)